MLHEEWKWTAQNQLTGVYQILPTWEVTWKTAMEMVKAWVIWKTMRETIWKVMMMEMILETMLKEDHSEVMMMVITRKEMEATKTLKTAMAQMIIVRVIIAKMVIVKAVIT